MSGMVFHVGDDDYDGFMGRYSTQLSALFADFAGVGGSQRVLDVGAGTGALTTELVRRVGAGAVAAAEPSSEFIAGLRQRLAGVDVRHAPAEEMPWENAGFDVVLAQLVVSFLTDAHAAAAEMARLTRPGGVVAVCMWHEQGLDLSPPLHAARRAAMPSAAPLPSLPLRTQEDLAEFLEGAGLRDVETTVLEVASEYTGFAEFWDRALARVGPETGWMQQVDDAALADGRDAAYRELGSPQGAFTLAGRAVAARAVHA